MLNTSHFVSYLVSHLVSYWVSYSVSYFVSHFCSVTVSYSVLKCKLIYQSKTLLQKLPVNCLTNSFIFWFTLLFIDGIINSVALFIIFSVIYCFTFLFVCCFISSFTLLFIYCVINSLTLLFINSFIHWVTLFLQLWILANTYNSNSKNWPHKLCHIQSHICCHTQFPQQEHIVRHKLFHTGFHILSQWQCHILSKVSYWH